MGEGREVDGGGEGSENWMELDEGGVRIGWGGGENWMRVGVGREVDGGENWMRVGVRIGWRVG